MRYGKHTMPCSSCPSIRPVALSVRHGCRKRFAVVEAAIPGTDVSVPLFFLRSNGKLVFWPGTFRRRIHTAGLREGLIDNYVTGMRGLLGAPPNRTEPSRNVKEVDVDAVQNLAIGFLKQLEEAS